MALTAQLFRVPVPESDTPEPLDRKTFTTLPDV